MKHNTRQPRQDSGTAKAIMSVLPKPAQPDKNVPGHLQCGMSHSRSRR